MSDVGPDEKSLIERIRGSWPESPFKRGLLRGLIVCGIPCTIWMSNGMTGIVASPGVQSISRSLSADAATETEETEDYYPYNHKHDPNKQAAKSNLGKQNGNKKTSSGSQSKGVEFAAGTDMEASGKETYGGRGHGKHKHPTNADGVQTNMKDTWNDQGAKKENTNRNQALTTLASQKHVDVSKRVPHRKGASAELKGGRLQMRVNESDRRKKNN